MILSSVCLGVAFCIVGLRVGAGVEKLYRRIIPRTGLPIHFLRYYCCRLYRSATTHSKIEPPKCPRLE